MRYRNLGHSGLKVSVIGLGTNRFGSEKVSQEAANNMIAAAQDMGLNFIDTANIYQGGRSEEALGIALKGRWDKFVLATKFSIPTGDGINDRGTSRYHIQHAIEDSLRRLQSDHIDLYYVHNWDNTTPIEETLRALDDLIRAGKVRYIGASNFSSWQLARANLLAEVKNWTPFVAIQNEYHMFERVDEREMLPFCKDHSVGYIPYFPLAGGFLTGKYERGKPAPKGSRGESSEYVKNYMTDANFDRLEKLQTFAAGQNRGINELAQAWLLANPQVSSVITGATRIEQMENNLKAADWELTEQELSTINQILA